VALRDYAVIFSRPIRRLFDVVNDLLPTGGDALAMVVVDHAQRAVAQRQQGPAGDLGEPNLKVSSDRVRHHHRPVISSSVGGLMT